MRQYTTQKTDSKPKFVGCTISNFMKWTKSLNRSRKTEDLDTFTVKSKLALTAFVNNLIKTHKKELIVADGVECTKYTHNCLYIALRQCYELDLRSQKVVSELIREIFLCEGNLHAIFSILSEGHVTRGFPRNGNLNIHTFTLYPKVNTKNFSDTVTHALTYYVQNIVILEKDAREKEISRYQPGSVLNKPMSEDEGLTPLMAATMRKDPELVLMLLRYGADPTISMDTDEYSPTVNPIQYTVTCLNSFSSIKSSSWLEKFHSVDKISDDGNRCQRILQYLQRAVHYVNFRVSTSLWSDEDGSNEMDHAYHIHPRLASTLVTGVPPTLQHLCRCSLRKHLAVVSCETIPDSIKHLPLPYIIKEFLDLRS